MFTMGVVVNEPIVVTGSESHKPGQDLTGEKETTDLFMKRDDEGYIKWILDIKGVNTKVMHYLLDKCFVEYVIDFSSQQMEIFEGIYNCLAGQQNVYLFDEIFNGVSKFDFLNYLVNVKNILLHGSVNREIEVLKPLTRNTISTTEKSSLLYASSDVYSAFKRIMNKNLHDVRCVHPFFVKGYRVDYLGHVYFYSFASISQGIMGKEDLLGGAIYICSSEGFTVENVKNDKWYSAFTGGNIRKIESSWVSRNSVVPLARMDINITDFPGVTSVHNRREMELKAMFSARKNKK